MIDLSSLVQSAQGGQAVNNIAQRFGLSPEQAQSAIDAVLPAIKMGMQNASQNGNAGEILAHMGSPVHQQSYEVPSTTPPDPAAGGSILGSLFGGHQATTGVAQQASAQSGVSASVIQAMLPMIVSMVLGGLMHGAQTGGLGGALSNILGSVLGQGTTFGRSSTAPAGSGQASYPSAPESGGLGGLIGSVLGGLMGGGGQPAAPSPQPPAEDGSSVPSIGGAASSATPESTLDEISSMIQPGTPSAPQHESNLASILGR